MNEEQKRREMQIEEMAQIICGRSKDDICLIDKTSCDSSCRWARDAEAIYNAGYRKADEVRKETAEKIFNKIKIKVLTEDMTEDRPQTLYRFTSFDIMKMAREIVEEFGVVFANGHATVEIKE